MCHLVRQHQVEAESSPAREPAIVDRVRPRWAGALAAAVIGVVAFAALVSPHSTATTRQMQEGAALVPVALRTSTDPTVVGGGGQGQLPADDGVPTTADSRSGMGHCHEGM